MLYCFLDTNIFLQFKTFDEVDWAKILGVKEVCLVVPFEVIRELDKKKNDSNNRLKRRARTILPKLEIYNESLDTENRNQKQIKLILLTEHPSTDWLKDHQYDPQISDDVIVGSVDYFGLRHPEFDVALLSDDSGPRLKAKSRKIQVFEPPDHLRLPEEPDPLQKELAEVKLALAKYENAQPKLSLGFVETGEVKRQIEFKIKLDNKIITDNEIKAMIEDQRAYLAYTGEVAPDITADEAHHIFIMNGEVLPFQSEVDEYHAEVEKYLQRIPVYFQELEFFRKYEAYTRTIILSLGNTGSSPAENIRLSVQFPNGILLTQSPETQPIEPTAPEKPHSKKLIPSTLNYLHSNFIADSLRSIRPANPHSELPLLSSFRIQQTDDISQVNVGLRKLSHFEQYEFKPLYITFEQHSKLPTGLEITYRIIADNLPNSIEGKLLIRLVSQK